MKSTWYPVLRFPNQSTMTKLHYISEFSVLFFLLVNVVNECCFQEFMQLYWRQIRLFSSWFQDSRLLLIQNCYMLLLTENSKMVDMGLLDLSNCLVLTRSSHFTVWRSKEGNHGIWGEEINQWLLRKLLWLSLWWSRSYCNCSPSISTGLCLCFCFGYRKTQLSEEVKRCSSHFQSVKTKCCLILDNHVSQ